MAARWKVGIYLAASLTAFFALLLGFLALAVHPIFGVLLSIGSMALLLYGVSGLCGASGLERLDS